MNTALHQPGIYVIRNIRDNKVYVGQALDVYHRFNCHKSMLKYGKHTNFYLQRVYDKYGPDVLSYEVIDYFPERCLTAIERFWIDNYNSINRKFGYNLMLAQAHTAETRAKIAAGNLGKKRPGQKRPWQSITLRSNPIGKYERTAEWRQKASIRNTGRGEKQVVQIALDGTVIKVWESISKAAVGTGTSMSTINNHTKGKTTNFKSLGYTWRWPADVDSFDPSKIFSAAKSFTRSASLSTRSVNQYTLAGVFVKTWINPNVAERELGICPTTVRRVCNNKAKTAGGFKWAYH